ncbi:MAG: methyltransferase domain-containing protein [Candidatus Aenigmatarchaeota archaeon]
MFPESAQSYRNGEDADLFLDALNYDLRDAWGVDLKAYLGKRVIDVGSGCGYMVKRLQEKGVDCYGLEGDPERAEFAKSVVKYPEKIIRADARSMPFPTGYFGVALSTMLYDHQEQDYDIIFASHANGNPMQIVKVLTYPQIVSSKGENRDRHKDRSDIKNEILRVMEPGGIYLVRDFIVHAPLTKFFSGFEMANPSNELKAFIALRKPINS